MKLDVHGCKPMVTSASGIGCEGGKEHYKNKAEMGCVRCGLRSKGGRERKQQVHEHKHQLVVRDDIEMKDMEANS